MEIVIAVRLQILRAADARIRHDRRAAARLVGRRSVAVAAAARSSVAVEAVVGAKLMSHFVRDVVNIKRVADGTAAAGDALRLPPCATGNAQVRHAAAAGAEDVTDVVVGRADDRIEVGLILAEHRAAIVICVRIGGGVGVDDQVIVGNQDHAHRHFALVHPVHAIHRDDDGGQAERDRAAEELRVFAGRGYGQAIGAQLRSRRRLRMGCAQRGDGG